MADTKNGDRQRVTSGFYKEQATIGRKKVYDLLKAANIQNLPQNVKDAMGEVENAISEYKKVRAKENAAKERADALV